MERLLITDERISSEQIHRELRSKVAILIWRCHYRVYDAENAYQAASTGARIFTLA